MEPLAIDTKVKLNSDIDMPVFGLGTYEARGGKETREAVLYALGIGYRLIDTAAAYGNEEDVGDAIRKSQIPRKEIFVTTKLRNSDHGYGAAMVACEKSLKKLGLSYVDLYLIHWPLAGLRNDSYRAMEQLLQEGKCRAIGVSNYMIWHLKDLFEHSSTIPTVNQVEFSPYLHQDDLLQFCRSHDIILEGYSPITKGHKLNDPKLLAVALRYSKTAAQILIRWALQKGTIVIPKSSSRERIVENSNVFDFSVSEEDMGILDSFDEGYRTSWDPTGVE